LQSGFSADIGAPVVLPDDGEACALGVFRDVSVDPHPEQITSAIAMAIRSEWRR
jgi:hypothetical protein